MYYRLAVVALLTTILAGCAVAPKQPAWVEGNDPRYPQTRYLIGRGEGSTAALARDRARADLAKVFETRIVEQSEDTTQAGRSTEGDAVVMKADETARRSLFTSSDQTVEGMRIADVWFDEPAKLHHALAVLDRNAAAARLRDQISALDSRTERAIAAAGNEADPLRRLAPATEAVTAQRERAVYQRYLRILDPTGIGLPGRYDAERLARDRDQLASRVKIAVSGEGADAKAVAGLLSGAITAAGFTPAPAENADYLLKGELPLDEFVADGWHWAQGNLHVELLDKKAVVRASADWPVKGAGQRPQAARQQALKEATELLGRQLYPLLMSGKAQ